MGRCFDPKHQFYYLYGGRGIGVCERWQKSFESFLEDMGSCPKSCTLDRIDGDKDYSPDNCRWATITQQNRNARSNVMVTFAGKTQCVTAWAKEVGIKPATLRYRIHRGWPIKQALSLAPHTGNVVVPYKAE